MSRTVGDVRILDRVTVHVPDAGITVVAGPSGGGKTSLLRLLNRLDVPTAGTVSWRGRDLATLDPCRLRRSVGYVAQRPVVFPGTSADNLRVADPTLDAAGVDRLLCRVGLDGLADRDAAVLSGGQAQRLCVARTLATQPAVILADEPTAALDEDARRALEDLARSLANGSDGIGWVWVSHDADQIRRIADRVITVDAGRVVAS